MKQYIIKRILSAIPLLIIISFVCFVSVSYTHLTLPTIAYVYIAVVAVA